MVTTFSHENNHVSTMAYMLIASYPVTNSDAAPSMFCKHLPKVLIRRLAMDNRDNRGMWLHSTSFHGESYSQNHPKSINCKVCLILILNVYVFYMVVSKNRETTNSQQWSPLIFERNGLSAMFGHALAICSQSLKTTKDGIDDDR